MQMFLSLYFALSTANKYVTEKQTVKTHNTIYDNSFKGRKMSINKTVATALSEKKDKLVTENWNDREEK